MSEKYGPMYQKAIDAGKFNPDTPQRNRIKSIIEKIPEANRDLGEKQLRDLMREAAESGARDIHYLRDGRASVKTNITKRFAPHYRESLKEEKLDQVEAQMREIGYDNFITATITTGRNQDRKQMNFEVVLPKTEADLALTGGISFFPKTEGQVADGFMIILPKSPEQTVNISKSDCAAVVEGTNYPGNAGKKTVMTIAGWVASNVGLIMEHFGLGEVVIRDPGTGKKKHFNIKVGGASFTGKTTTLTSELSREVALRGAESKSCYNDDMIFTDPKTRKAYSMESGQFFTCSELTEESDKALWDAHLDPKTIAYNIVVRDDAFDFHDKKTDPNARIAVRRGAHSAIEVDRFNTEDTEHSSGVLDVSLQLFRGPHFPPGFMVKDPEMAAILLAAGPTQKTAAQVGGSGEVKVNGFHGFKPIMDEKKFQEAIEAKSLMAVETLFEPALVRELLTKSSNYPVPVAQLINELFVSGFIMENSTEYMNKVLELYESIPMHLGLNTGKVGPMVASAIVRPFEGATVRVYDMSVALPPFVSQDILIHALRGEIKTEFDPLLQVDVITKAGGTDLTPILPRTLYKKAGIDYEATVKKAYSRYADKLEEFGLPEYAKKLRNGKSS